MAAEAYRRRVLDAELDELLTELSALAIEGPKAVGKTATALQRATTVFELDDPQQRAVAQADLDRLVDADPPVLIDEWQLVPAAWDRVRRAVDGGAPAGRYLLTGSSAPKDTGTHSGGGRIVSTRLRPLSLAERVDAPSAVSLAALLTGQRDAIAGSTDMRVADYTAEILRSGFPGLRHLSGRPLRSQLDGYIARIVDRDFPELGHAIRDADGLRRWMAAYAGGVVDDDDLRADP